MRSHRLMPSPAAPDAIRGDANSAALASIFTLADTLTHRPGKDEGRLLSSATGLAAHAATVVPSAG